MSHISKKDMYLACVLNFFTILLKYFQKTLAKTGFF